MYNQIEKLALSAYEGRGGRIVPQEVMHEGKAYVALMDENREIDDNIVAVFLVEKFGVLTPLKEWPDDLFVPIWR